MLNPGPVKYRGRGMDRNDINLWKTAETEKCDGIFDGIAARAFKRKLSKTIAYFTNVKPSAGTSKINILAELCD